jgi:hypothetical protein
MKPHLLIRSSFALLALASSATGPYAAAESPAAPDKAVLAPTGDG